MDMDTAKQHRLIDFHSHILPGMDDGSKTAEMSRKMLAASAEQGVACMVATPHFYAAENSPEKFLKRRQQAWERLQSVMTEQMPRVRLGAEVYYFAGMSRSEELKSLRVEGTKVLLLEMPFHRWPNSAIEEAAAMASDPDYTVVMAHIDRYLKTTDDDTWRYLAKNGAFFQMNADFIAGGWMKSRQAVRLIENGVISVIASDCHNMDTRKPNLDAAVRVIEKKLGAEAVEKLTQNAEKLLRINIEPQKAGAPKNGE